MEARWWMNMASRAEHSILFAAATTTRSRHVNTPPQIGLGCVILPTHDSYILEFDKIKLAYNKVHIQIHLLQHVLLKYAAHGHI